MRGEERIGLMVALGLHVLLVIALLMQPATREVIPQPQRMTVSLAEDVGLAATAPDPVPESRAATAPTLSDDPAPVAQPAAETPPLPRTIERPQPAAQPEPAPQPRAEPAPAPRPKPTARKTPTAKPSPTRPSPKSESRPSRSEAKAEPKAQPKSPAKSSAKSEPAPAKAKSGGSRLGDNFLAGAGDSATSSETRVPASQIGASAKASLVQAIARKIKPKWEPPSGPDVEKITTFLRFRLNPDGSLSGRPEVVRQTGVNDTNRAQAGRHGEQAIRAVQLAAPFDDLPSEYYEAWKLVGPFSFDWKLAQ